MKSSMALERFLKIGGNWNLDITDYCWPTYRRYSLANGGDAQATFTVKAKQAILEDWFKHYLGYHFIETYGGNDAFQGYIHTMRYAANGVTLSKSMADVYNKIAVKYKTSSAGSDTYTSFASDAGSVAKFGTRTLIYAVDKTYINSTAAAALRDDLLEALAWPSEPTVESVSLDQSDETARLAVTVRGYAETLDGVLLKDTSTTNSTASAQVTAALSGADFVTAGTVETNSTVVTEEVDYVGAWQRIKGIVGLRGGGVWLAGCYQGRALDYFQADLSTIKHYVDVRRRGGGRVIMDANQEPAALPLVKPIGMVQVRDMEAIEVKFLMERVEYSAAGLVLQGVDSTGLAQAVALQMVLGG